MSNNKIIEFCQTCHSRGFNKSIITDMCEFCDGTEGGQPPASKDVLGRDNKAQFNNLINKIKAFTDVPARCDDPDFNAYDYPLL